MNWQPKHPSVKQLIAALRSESAEPYLVGGAVRDLLLDPANIIKDFDFIVPEPAIAVARRVADKLGWAFYPLDEAREIARILFVDGQQPPFVCDIARMRGDSIEADMLARDFTINAIALGWRTGGETHLVDLCGGRHDLKMRILRRVSPVSLAEDAIRLLRAPRFIAQLGLTLDSETDAQIIRLARTLQLAGAERVRDELWKALATDRPVLVLTEMRRLGLMPHSLPELAATIGIQQSPPHHEDVFNHSLQVVAHAARLRTWLCRPAPLPATNPAEGQLFAMLDPWRYRLRQLFTESVSSLRTRAEWLVWHALFHDTGKPPTQTLESSATIADDMEHGSPPRIRFFRHEEVGTDLTFKRLSTMRFSRLEISLAQRVVSGHMRPHHLHASFGSDTVSRRAAFRFYRDVTLKQPRQMAGFDILLLALCDQLAIIGDHAPEEWNTYLRRINDLFAFGFEQIDLAAGNGPPLVDGRTIMRHFNLKPGPHIGLLLEHLQEAQVAGEIHSVEEALALAGQRLDRSTGDK